MPSPFELLFRSQAPARDKLLARFFGIFSEEVVRIWCRCPDAPYEDLGRPTLRLNGSDAWSTLDFLLARRDGSGVFVAEMKCELEYLNYRYLTLTDPAQLEHHCKPAFTIFLKAASAPSEVAVTASRTARVIDGAILVWGDATEAGRAATIAKYGLADVLTVSTMIQDLNRWKPMEWTAFISDRRRWTGELFSGLETLAASVERS